MYISCVIWQVPPYLSSPSYTNSGTLVLRRIGFRCHHSPRRQTACIPLSEGGSTRAEHILNRPPLTSAPGSGLHVWWKIKKRLKIPHKLRCCSFTVFTHQVLDMLQNEGNVSICLRITDYIIPVWWSLSHWKKICLEYRICRWKIFWYVRWWIWHQILIFRSMKLWIVCGCFYHTVFISSSSS